MVSIPMNDSDEMPDDYYHDSDSESKKNKRTEKQNAKTKKKLVFSTLINSPSDGKQSNIIQINWKDNSDIKNEVEIVRRTIKFEKIEPDFVSIVEETKKEEIVKLPNFKVGPQIPILKPAFIK